MMESTTPGIKRRKDVYFYATEEKKHLSQAWAEQQKT
jgi:hypothetical protein